MNDQDKTKKERASKLIIANKENAYKLASASKAVTFKNNKKGKHLDALIDSNVDNALALSIVANKELAAQNIEKEKRIVDLIQAREKAEESDNLKSAFLANMYHEIRTPMNSILGFANLLKEPELVNEKQQKYLKIIEKSGERLLNTINNIVDMSKIHSGQVKVNLRETNINKQIEKIYNFFKSEADSKGINFVFKNSLPTKEAFFLTDCEKIYAILIHLVKNALSNTSEGSIEFGYTGTKSSTCKTEIMFFVKDTGVGIPKDRQKAIFENFTQSDISNKMALQGNGLGLSITKSYVTLLGGKIWAESDEGKGAKFYFSLPYRIDLDDKLIHNAPLC
ncbi:MAG TPA: ATP-binding protein [Lutibacter sp.]|nr:ATP-binding protein [Lutibacter sp.]